MGVRTTNNATGQAKLPPAGEMKSVSPASKSSRQLLKSSHQAILMMEINALARPGRALADPATRAPLTPFLNPVRT